MKRFVIILMSALCFFASFGTVAQAASDNLTPNNNESGDLGITIDGNFDDWADKTKKKMGHPWDDDNYKYVSLLNDANNIYIYVLMKPKLQGGDTGFQHSDYTLSVGGQMYYVSFNNHTDVHLNVGEKKFVPINIYQNSDSDVNLNNAACVSRQNITQYKYIDKDTLVPVPGTGYVFEAKIPFKSLKGISNTSGQKVTLENNTLWSGKVESAGGSTGPVVLASTGFVIAIAAVLKYSGFNFKKRRSA
jgi:uncharacterized protein (TIGR04145 family)